jgi:type II secretory pathway pseudopilin PulG
MNNSIRSLAWRTNRSGKQLTGCSSDQPLLQTKKKNKTQMYDLKTTNKRARQGGTTLIELSVVIAVLLLLVGVLFIGISAWKDGANKAACVLNISSAQKALRGYQNMNPGAAAPTMPVLVTAGFFGAAPVCPAAGTYTYNSVVAGTAWSVCSLAGSKGHAPVSTSNW